MSLASVQQRILRACERAGRDPGEVQLIAVTKQRSLDTIREKILHHADLPLAENRVQEWRDKYAQAPAATWHFIGNLQRNKVKYCQGISLFHSVNSQRLGETLSARAQQWGKEVDILLEVNVSGEASKAGAPLADAEALMQHLQALPALRLRGLMTMAPYSDSPEDARPYFAKLRQLRDAWGLEELSMGMSGDFEIAIEEGATMVRIGSALFED